MSRRSLQTTGPFTADQLRSGDTYELSHGHPIQCAPTGRRGSTRNLTGGAALETDPKVVSAGVDLGVSTEPGMLRAPDVAVGQIEDEPGWAKRAPPLAVEYADVGQEEHELQEKIAELLDAGTKFIWVVRLAGERRVEVYEPNKRMHIVTGDAVLSAPGVLQNVVPLDVLYDRDAAHEATLRNLLQRKGYQDLSQVLEKGRSEGHSEGRSEGRMVSLRASILAVLEARSLETSAVETRVNGEHDLLILEGWLRKAATAGYAIDIFSNR
jgi:Uma2 family endonuclease